MAVQSVLGPGGVSKQPYGSFIGKVEPLAGKAFTKVFSVLSPTGISKQPYSSFAGKVAFEAVASVLRNIMQRRRRF